MLKNFYEPREKRINFFDKHSRHVSEAKFRATEGELLKNICT